MNFSNNFGLKILSLLIKTSLVMEILRKDEQSKMWLYLALILRKLPEPKVCNLADELGVDEDVAGGQVTVYVAHLGQVLHPVGDAAHHSNQLHHLNKDRMVRSKIHFFPIYQYI